MKNAPAPNTDEWPNSKGHPSGTPDKTDEYSFILRPDSHGGVGVFTTHPIKAGITLRLYDESNGYKIHKTVAENSIPGEFIKFCTDEGNGMVTRPADFSRIDLVWFLNHSDNPNAAHNDQYQYTSLRDLSAHEEILIDYEKMK